jgi:DNA-binding transcriptional ArsR family regulator
VDQVQERRNGRVSLMEGAVVMATTTSPDAADELARFVKTCDPERLVTVLTTLASKPRIEIIRLLSDGEDHELGEIAAYLGINKKSTAGHLSRFEVIGVVASSRRYPRSLNRLADPRVLDVCRAVAEFLRPLESRPGEQP